MDTGSPSPQGSSSLWLPASSSWGPHPCPRGPAWALATVPVSLEAGWRGWGKEAACRSLLLTPHWPDRGIEPYLCTKGGWGMWSWMYAVGHGALERIRTDTGVDYRRQSSPKADPALGVRSPCPGHVQWHHCLDQELMNSQASQYSCWSVDYRATHHFKHWKLWNLCSNNTSYGNPLSYAWTHISLLKSEVGSL